MGHRSTVKHFGTDHPDVEQNHMRYIPSHYDEFLRPTLRSRPINKRGDYDNENPAYLSGIYFCLVERINELAARSFKAVYNSQYIDLKKPLNDNGEIFHLGLVSRQPYGENWYSPSHPEYKPERPWNTVSKEEYLGDVVLMDSADKYAVTEYGIENDWTFDDYLMTKNKDFKHPKSYQYMYLKAVDRKTTFIQKLAFDLNKLNANLKYAVARILPRKKFTDKFITNAADSMIKQMLKRRVLDKPPLRKSKVRWAIDNYFSFGHPFTVMVEEIDA